jgi:quinoprotein glucose dehydrogenase
MAVRSLLGYIARCLYALLLVAIGLVLGYGGWHLLRLGGSPYYLAAGIVLVASGGLVLIGDRRGARLYGAFLIATLAWAIWEAGFDGWGLAARLIAPALLGIGFLFRARHREPEAVASGFRLSQWRGPGIGVAGALLVGMAAHAIGPADYADPLYQIGMDAAVPAPHATAGSPQASAGDWQHYGNDIGGSRYSGLDQLTPATVGGLKPAWQVDVGPPPGGGKANLEVTPLKVGNALYACTGYNDVLSIDAETGHINWRFRSGIALAGRPSGTCRGVAYFQVPGATGPCATRIITNTIDARLIALDAASGRLCPGFGTNGQTDLTIGMGAVDKGYYVSSAPTIVRGKIVLGGRVSDGEHWGGPSGVIRAYDAVTGKFAWAFDMGRPDDHGEPPPGKTYTRSTPNSWAPMSADPALGLVYAPIGNAAPDYFGAQRRPFDELYSSAVIALDVETGALKWSFQTTHHDLWDYDVASQPTLIDIPTAQGVQHALVQPTKRGEIFLLDRATGKPLTTVEERGVAQDGRMPDDRVSYSHPFSDGLPALGGARWRERDMWGLTPIDQLWCRITFKQARYGGTMTPPGITPGIADPGHLGAVNWGGVSVDPLRSLLIVNSSRVGDVVLLIPHKRADAHGSGPGVQGSPGAVAAQDGTPYAAQVKPFVSPLGMPCNEPPYGRITAIDLRSHKLVWTRPLGTARDSGPNGIASLLPIPVGVPNAGGSITTAGGLIFIAATRERTIRALDLRTGAERWSASLPAVGQATPMTYWSDRSKRQFVVIAAGGNVVPGSRAGDAIIAYALPR